MSLQLIKISKSAKKGLFNFDSYRYLISTLRIMKHKFTFVKPILSTNHDEARKKMLGLYKACYRYIPYIVHTYDMPKNEQECKWKLRERFYKNACVTDLRVIDLLIAKGYMELDEVINVWQQKCHVMANWKPTMEPKPTTFIGKFLANMD